MAGLVPSFIITCSLIAVSSRIKYWLRVYIWVSRHTIKLGKIDTVVFDGLPTLRLMKTDGALEWLQVCPASFAVVLVEVKHFTRSIGDGMQSINQSISKFI